MLRQEFAVIGLGRFGRHVAMTLERYGHNVLGIDSNPDIVQLVSTQIAQVVTLDATNENALRAVDITSFDTVIVAIGTDFEANLMTTVSLKELGVKRVICKAPTSRQEQILLRVGADKVVRPEQEAGQRLAEGLIAPTMLENFALGPDTDYRIAEFLVPSSVACMSLSQSNIRHRFGLSVLVVKRGGEVIVSPGADVILQPKDILVMLGHQKEIAVFSELH
jgi:trk system potassium uptake protein TrkA